MMSASKPKRIPSVWLLSVLTGGMCMYIEYEENGVRHFGVRRFWYSVSKLNTTYFYQEKGSLNFKSLAFLPYQLLYFASLPDQAPRTERPTFTNTNRDTMIAEASDWSLSAPIERVSRIPRLRCQRNAAAVGRNSGLSQASATVVDYGCLRALHA